jgi:hypothetical protein
MDVGVDETGQKVITRSIDRAIGARATGVANRDNAAVARQDVALDHIESIVHRQDCRVSNQKGGHPANLSHLGHL